MVSWLTVRSSVINNLVTDTPSLLYFRGQFLRKAMQEKRVTQAQLLAVVRENRIGSLDHVEAIVMETAGTISVIKKVTVDPSGAASTLNNVQGVHSTN